MAEYARVGDKPRRIMLGRFPEMTVEQGRCKALSLLEGIDTGTSEMATGSGQACPPIIGNLWELLDTSLPR